MRKTCDPVLLPKHPMLKDVAAKHMLPPMDDVFVDFRTAQAGQPVGISITVTQYQNEIHASDAAELLISQGPAQPPETMSTRDAIRADIDIEIKNFLIFTPSILREMGEIRDIDWQKHGWASSSRTDGVHMRKFWIFPRGALLMDNVHYCYVEDLEELPYLALVMFNPSRSNHEALDLSTYLNDLLDIASIAAISDVVLCWAQDVPEGRIPFAKVDPAKLQLTRTQPS
jgi:hypothetical protein